MKHLLFITLLFCATLAVAQNNNFSWIRQQTYIATGTNSYAINIPQYGTSGIMNSEIKVQFANGNTGASTITINGGAAMTLRKNGSSALASGDIVAGATYRITFDGTYWQVLGIGGSGSVAWGDITGKPTTIAGYGITDFNSLGDARWLRHGTGQTITSNTSIHLDNTSGAFSISSNSNSPNYIRFGYRVTGSGSYHHGLWANANVAQLQYQSPTVYHFFGATSTALEANGVSNNTPFLIRTGTANLRYYNPANTFYYNIARSAITANLTATLPLLSGNDTFVFESHSQTITNKTIGLSANTVSGTKANFNSALSDGDFLFTNEAQTVTAKKLFQHTMLEIGDNDASHRYIFMGGNITSDQLMYLPNLTGSDYFLFESHAAGMFNKTFYTGNVFANAPTINEGVKFTFYPDATNAGMNVGSRGSHPSGTVDGDFWNQSTLDRVFFKNNGVDYQVVGVLGDYPFTSDRYTLAIHSNNSSVIGTSSLLWNDDGNAINTRDDSRTETGASYELVLADEGVTLRFTNSGTITINLPDGLPTGFKCAIELIGTGEINLTADTTLNSAGTTCDVQYTGFYVEHLGSNVWLAIGALN